MYRYCFRVVGGIAEDYAKFCIIRVRVVDLDHGFRFVCSGSRHACTIDYDVYAS
jgi:hypothetical protein